MSDNGGYSDAGALWVNRPRRCWSGLWIILILLSLQDCATIVIPPVIKHGGEPVFLLDHGRHAGLVLPTPDNHIVRYSYGDWTYYARNMTGPYQGTSALLWPTQGALGRRELPGPPTVAAIEQQVKVPIVHVYRVIVEQARVEQLRQHLDSVFEGNKDTLLYNPLYDLYFVHDPEPYDISHDSNQVAADWLKELGCKIRGGPVILSNWKIGQSE